MISGLGAIMVALVGLYLVGLGLMALLHPDRAVAFFNGFARSASVHYAELAIRFFAGAAFLVTAPRLLFPGAFVVVAWALLVTTIALALIPWRWHRAFAERGVPYAIRNLPLVAIGSCLMGISVLVALVFG